jgi:ribosomal protein L11 methyltransferase
MFSIDIECGQADREIAIAELWEAGCTGIIERDESIRVFFDDDARQPELLARFGGDAQPADTRDWVAFAREHLKPMPIGERIFVIPEWCDDPTPPGRFRITINAGLAFGTGAHETTRLCLEALERHVKTGATVIDIGTGSGILCEAALKLGARRALASDTDPDAVAVAKENFARAGVEVAVFTGSADAVADNAADVVVANISPAWIAELANDWVRILKPGGVGILSGFEAADVAGVSAALEKAGGRVRGVFGDGEWRMIEIDAAQASDKAT